MEIRKKSRKKSKYDVYNGQRGTTNAGNYHEI